MDPTVRQSKDLRWCLHNPVTGLEFLEAVHGASEAHVGEVAVSIGLVKQGVSARCFLD